MRLLRAPGSSDVYNSLSNTHSSFETPCGSYAHFKLTRYLLRVTRDPRYGDSMERMMYNTMLGCDAARSRWPDLLLLGLQLQRAEGLFASTAGRAARGRMPQVAADYRINTYFRDARGVYVNLYIPSTLRWTQDGAQISLTQKSEYPYDSHVQFEVKASRPAEFAVNLRIPAWAEGLPSR